MESIRRWFYRPKKDDTSLLAQFFYADEALNIIANELDSFDGRKDPERCTTLVNQLRQSQDKVLTITNAIMDELIGDERVDRDFRVKFPEDVLQENLAGQLWFGAECLAAGSSIMNREHASILMRPLAKAVTKSLEHVRNLLRQACLRNNTPNGPLKLDQNDLITEMLIESLKIFDKFFADFELAYVSAMVPVKSTYEYELQELISVLFSETLQRALKTKLLSQEMVDSCDPALMFTIPRLAIVQGLLSPNDEPLHLDRPAELMSDMFRPFRVLLRRIRELMWTLDKKELYLLERLLCDNEDLALSDVKSVTDMTFDEDPCVMIDPIYLDYSTRLLQDESKSFMDKKGGRKDQSIDIPSTSTYPLVDYAGTSPIQHQSPPNEDSLKIISDAAATLSSILTKEEKNDAEESDGELDSPNDSGISTETASLDRSPTFEGEEKRCKEGCCGKTCKCRRKQGRTGGGKQTTSTSRRILSSRKRRQSESLLDGDSSSEESSEASSSGAYADTEDVATAVRAARIRVRAKYRSSEDLVHRLFVCVAGVADQLQTNFASDLRNILKAVFLINTSDSDETSENAIPSCLETSTASIEYHPAPADVVETNEFSVDPNILAQEALFDTNVYFHIGDGPGDMDGSFTNRPRHQEEGDGGGGVDDVASIDEGLYRITLRDDYGGGARREDAGAVERPPVWLPDVEAPKCMSCGANFTVVKRRHHCRNCGKIFCGRCSSNNVPLPKFGLTKPVRVCNKCFIYNLSPVQLVLSD
ncbi:lateral signaling target protein 2 homolog [Coccinella septempunctata]|uniref:lateral signaling target protein 2 homolog n=1 Tax=Coccinella septempunctata TaxID=41139 RepID=UPI001D08BC36|nr:lateral signaling target protein 2 homolog [Coccinella septempunctata]